MTFWVKLWCLTIVLIWLTESIGEPSELNLIQVEAQLIIEAVVNGTERYWKLFQAPNAQEISDLSKSDDGESSQLPKKFVEDLAKFLNEQPLKLKIKYSIRKRILRLLPQRLQKKLIYIFGEKIWNKIYGFLRN